MVDAPPRSVPRLFLIDAYALIYRSYFAFINNPLISSKGENTSAPFGFVRFLISLRDDYAPDYLAVIFDSGMSAREKLYPEYKATRDKMPPELRESLGRIRDLVEAFRYPLVEVDGYEADDVIGTLAREAVERGLEAVVVSGDKDFYQLVGPGVNLLNPGRGGSAGVEAHWVDESTATGKLGVPPDRVVDYLALIGDSSDNVPGAPGIGPKTAIKLLEEFGTVEDVLAHASEVSGKRARESLLENADNVRLSKRLVTIQTDVPCALDLDAMKVEEPDLDRLRELFIDLEFRKLIEEVTGTAGDEGATRKVRLDYRAVTDPAEVASLAARWTRAGAVSIGTVGSHPDPMRATLMGLAVASAEGSARYLPLRHEKAPALALGDLSPDTANLPDLASPEMAPLVAMLANPDVAKVGHDLKYDTIVLAEAGVELAGLDFDVMVASYVLNPGRRAHDLPALAGDLLDLTVPTRKDATGTGKASVPMLEIPVEKGMEMGARMADAAWRLHERFSRELREQSLDALFRRLEMPLVSVLARMERCGIGIDAEFFEEMSRRLDGELRHIDREIQVATGREDLNLNSTPQLREVLFVDLQLPVLKRTKTGPSTDAGVLEELAAMGHEVPRLLIEYRQLEKLRSTYVDALPQLVNRRTGRIHTSFNQAVAATGRLSSSDPNLQNIPIRTELGREVRKGFVAAPGHVFYSADYSQVELRILAHFSGDPAFVTAFTEGIDVHKQTASVIFDVAIDDVTAGMRAQAKTINFATLYGQGDFSLARSLGIPRDEAKAFIKNYFERFSGVRRYLDQQVALARERGYVETLAGRRRYIPELQSRNWNIRQFGERVAQNTPIQGTAADLIKQAMIDVQRALDGTGSTGRLLLQVHDELLFEVPEADVETLRPLVRSAMVEAMELAVPLDVDDGVGRTWYDCK